MLSLIYKNNILVNLIIALKKFKLERKEVIYMKMKNIRNNNNLLKLSRLNVFQELKTNRTLFIMLLPAILFFLLFKYLPMIGITLAFKNYNFYVLLVQKI
mgnify:CR=1 FL=1